MAEIVKENHVVKRRMKEYEDALIEMETEVRDVWANTFKMIHDTRCCARQSEGSEGMEDYWNDKARLVMSQSSVDLGSRVEVSGQPAASDE